MKGNGVITISLCMIVKNEEHTLERCLKSVAGIADEIVIADTGSTDNTKAVAEGLGARVVDFAWIDDFAAARNFAFDQGTMDYLMWLDADDVLSPEDRDKLLALKAELSPTVDAVSMLYHTAFDAAGNPITTARRFRIVRRDKNVRWAGVVHEDLQMNQDFRYHDSDIAVTHRKPPGDGTPSRRNLEIYERHLAAGRPMLPNDLFHYARELQMNQDYAKAIPVHHQFLDSDNTNVELTLFTLHSLATCYYMIGDLDKEWECTMRSLGLDAPRPEFSCRIGERFVAKNQFAAAIFWYEAALNQRGNPGGEWGIQSHPYRTWLPHKQLGLCYFQIGDPRRSLEHNRAAQRYLPDDEVVAANIAMLEDMLGQSRTATGPLGA